VIPAQVPAETDLATFVRLCGSKRSAAKAIGIPRKTLCRWLLDIERTGQINARPSRVRWAMERINVVRAKMRQDGPCYDVADAFMSVFGLHRADRGDDMTCARFPDSLSDATGKVTGQKQGQDFRKTYENGNNSAKMNGTKTGTRNQTKIGAGGDGPCMNCGEYHAPGEGVDGCPTMEDLLAIVRGLGTKRTQFMNRERNISQGGGTKRKTVLFLYDIHLPNHSEENIALALDYAQSRHEIDTVVLGGDFLDCAGISRWKKDPYGTMPLHEEIARGVAWLEALRTRFKKSEIVIMKGNHEDRLQSYLWNQAAEISKLKGLKLQDQLELERLNIRWVDNLERVQRGEGVYSIGKLNILHGHELGICPNINPARQYFLRALDNVICGHVHKVDEHFATTIAGKTAGAWVCGPLCDMHPEYRPLNPWVAGFAIAHFDDDGLFSVKLKKIIEGRVL